MLMRPTTWASVCQSLTLSSKGQRAVPKMTKLGSTRRTLHTAKRNAPRSRRTKVSFAQASRFCLEPSATRTSSWS